MPPIRPPISGYKSASARGLRIATDTLDPAGQMGEACKICCTATRPPAIPIAPTNPTSRTPALAPSSSSPSWPPATIHTQREQLTHDDMRPAAACYESPERARPIRLDPPRLVLTQAVRTRFSILSRN
jgi:hypothetical protein